MVKRCLPGTLRPPDGPIEIGFIVPKTADEGASQERSAN